MQDDDEQQEIELHDALEILFDAGGTRVPPWAAVVSALACSRPSSVRETIDWLVGHRDDLERAYDDGVAAPLDLARLRSDVRSKSDIVGKRSFFQTAVYAMTGIDLTSRDAEMLDEIGNANLLVDQQLGPMLTTRRVAARSGGFSASVVAGLAMMSSPMFAGEAAGNCARFLQRARRAVESGGTVEAYIEEILAQRERVMGFERPVVRSDQRVPIMTDVLERYGRVHLPFAALLGEAEDTFYALKGLRSTSAAWAAAILSDYGMTPDQVHAVSNYWIAVCVYAQGLINVHCP